MNYEVFILSRFLDKYERSTDYQKGNLDCKVLLNVDKLEDFQNRMENFTEKEAFFQVIRNLESKKIIEIKWVKYEKNNRIEKLYLINIPKAYQLLKRKPKQDAVDQFTHLFDQYLSTMVTTTDLYSYLKELKEASVINKRIPIGFSEDLDLDEKMFMFFALINSNTKELKERVLSVSLYQDSKCFERYVKSKALIILRQLHQKQNEEKIDDVELLELYGVTRWPEVMEFCGNISVTMEDGKQISYYGQSYGSYINSEMISHIKCIEEDTIYQVMFIENKANYIWYLSHVKRSDELVVFHGGVYSPSKGKLFHLIKEGLGEDTNIYHWSDIDAGGFRIFTRLQNNIFSQVRPYQMDEETLIANKTKCIPLGSASYKKILEQMLTEGKYKGFKDAIQYMLENDVKLEQETLIE